MQRLPQSFLIQANIFESLIEASDCALIHFIVLSVSAMHPDDGCFVPIRIGIRSRAAEGFGPISSKPLHVLRMEAMAESMRDDLVG